MATSLQASASRPKAIHFTQHFGIPYRQAAVEFVDIPLNTDGPLFLDPYAFKINNDIWSIECNNLLVDFFQALIDAIRVGELSRAAELMNPLREPNETRLGFSAGRPAGRGMGRLYNQEMVRRLQASRAVRTGYLRDLCDCELLIPHVSSDRISDITANVIRHKLIEFTQEQCRQYEVPMRVVAGNEGWDPENQFWLSKYAKLPVYNGDPIILVPKWAVRKKMTYDHQEYWRYWCVEYLQQEHISSNTALVHTLKSGKKEVYKKDVEKELPCDKEAIAKFSQEHPEVFKKYKQAAPAKRPPLSETELNETVYADSRLNITIVQSGGNVVNNHNHNVVKGNVVGGVVGGSGTVNARDISMFRDRISTSIADSDVRQALLDARERIETSKLTAGDKVNAADTLGQLTLELEKPQPSPGIVKKCLGILKDYAQPVYHALMGVKTISDLYQLS